MKKTFLLPLCLSLFAALVGCQTRTHVGPALPPAQAAPTGPAAPQAPRPKPTPKPDPFAPYPIPQKPETGASPLIHGPDIPLYQRQQ